MKELFFCFILPALISSHFVDTTCLEGSTIVLSCEVSVEDIGGIWYKDDSVVVESSQIYPTVNSRIHQLNIFQSEIKDGGKYVFKIRDKISSAILTVKCTTSYCLHFVYYRDGNISSARVFPLFWKKIFGNKCVS
jgi:hypothetical protein